MLIADAQVHVWWPHTSEYPIIGKPHRPQPFPPEALLTEMDGAGVRRALMIPPNWQQCTGLALQAAAACPDRLAVIGRLDLGAADVCKQLAELRGTTGMMGIRVSQHQTVADDGSMDAALAAAQDHGVPIMINAPVVPGSRPQPIAYMAERFPGLKLAIDHLALVHGQKDDEAFAYLDRLLDLAKYPNVSVKATSLPTYTGDAYPYRRLHGHFRRVYHAFGPRRIFWGSDISKLPCPYRDCVTLFTEAMPWLTRDDKEWIMGRALCEWVEWQ